MFCRFILCMCFAQKYGRAMHMPRTHKAQKWPLGPLKLERWMAVRYHVMLGIKPGPYARTIVLNH